jgi:hypothetical protein
MAINQNFLLHHVAFNNQSHFAFDKDSADRWKGTASESYKSRCGNHLSMCLTNNSIIVY